MDNPPVHNSIELSNGLSRHESFCPGSAQIPFILTKNTVSAFEMRLTIVTVHEKSRERNKKNRSR